MLSRAATIAYGCFIPLTVLTWGLLNAVISLVIFIQAYSLMHRKEERNYYHIFLMSFFLLLGACSQSPEPSIAVALLLFLLSAIWAFMSLRLHVETCASQSILPDILPLHAAISSVPSDAGSPFDAGLVASVSLVSLLAVLLTLGVFLGTPRIEAGFLGRGEGEIARTGLNRSVDLSRAGLLMEDQRAVMHAEFPEEPERRYGGPLYWRVTTMPQYYRSQWNRRSLRETYEPGPSYLIGARSGGPLDVFRKRMPDRRVVHQTIYMDEVPEEGLPCLDLPQRVLVSEKLRNAALAWDDAQDFSIVLRTTASRRLSYDVWSEVDTPSPDALRAEVHNYQERLSTSDYEVLTYQDLLRETRERVTQITRDAKNDYDRVLAIQSWLSGPDFVYSTAIPALPPDHAIDSFLTTYRRGHCELFASAMALMIRSQGIPARVVSGFRGGDWSGIDQSYTVRASMAHLWVEVLFPTHGWVVFDPSPRLDEAPTGLRRMTSILSSYLLRAKMFWYQRVIRYDSGLQFSRLRNLSLNLIRSIWSGDAEPSAASSAGPGTVSRRTLFVVTVLLCAAAVAALLWMRRRKSALRRLLTEDQARAVQLYQRFRRRLRRSGLDIRGKSPRELLNELAARGALGIERAEAVLKAYHDARFGKRPLARALYASLKRELRLIRLP